MLCCVPGGIFPLINLFNDSLLHCGRQWTPRTRSHEHDIVEAAETTCWASGGVSSDMASSIIDEGPEQDWPDFYIDRPVKVSNKENKNTFSRIAQFFAIFGKRQQRDDDDCGTGRSRQLRLLSTRTTTTTPLTRSFGDKGTSSAKRDDPPGIGCQEQESTNGRTVYETDVWHHSSLSRRVSFTVSHVQRSCHHLRPPQKSPTRHRKTSILTILSVYSSTITPVFKMRWFTRNNEPNVCLDLSVAYVFQLSRCTLYVHVTACWRRDKVFRLVFGLD